VLLSLLDENKLEVQLSGMPVMLFCHLSGNYVLEKNAKLFPPQSRPIKQCVFVKKPKSFLLKGSRTRFLNFIILLSEVNL